jgi:hypothetical protein
VNQSSLCLNNGNFLCGAAQEQQQRVGDDEAEGRSGGASISKNRGWPEHSDTTRVTAVIAP